MALLLAFSRQRIRYTRAISGYLNGPFIAKVQKLTSYHNAESNRYLNNAHKWEVSADS